jgi:hypothetical protein
MARVLTSLCALALLVPVLVAQHETAKPPAEPRPAQSPKQGHLPPPQHDPQPQLSPDVALRHLRAGYQALASARSEGRAQPEPMVRPAGAGRWITAVVTCACANVDVPRLFGLRREDMLLLSSPGPVLRGEDLALLERAAADERLSLCVVLTHADCAALRQRSEPSLAQQALERAIAPARALAAERSLPLPQAQALVQRDALLSGSDPLRALAQDGRFRAVPCSVDPRTLELRWHTTVAEELPIAPVK